MAPCSVDAVRTRVTRCFTFDAAHQLPWHPGRCRNLHGHTYKLEVSVEGAVGPNGIVCDFAELDAVVRSTILDRLDHTYLNDLMDNPTAELIAADIWKRLEADAPGELVHIKLWETPDSAVELSR